MAKRSAEDTLLHEAPSKKLYHALSSAALQLESMDPIDGSVSRRKRPQYFEDPEKQEEAAVYRKPMQVCDTRKQAANVLTVHASGSFQERGSSSTLTSAKKRPRDDCAGSETVILKADDKSQADEDTNAEDCTYNSFQFWRVPLPELDLSLLEDVNDHYRSRKDESKVKDSSSDAMET